MVHAYRRGTSAKSWGHQSMMNRLREHQRHLTQASDRAALTHQQRATAAESAEAVAWAINHIEDGGERFLIFGGERYYPNGGWFDIRHATDTIEEAQGHAKALLADDWAEVGWTHIVDITKAEIVATYGEPAYGQTGWEA